MMVADSKLPDERPEPGPEEVADAAAADVESFARDVDKLALIAEIMHRLQDVDIDSSEELARVVEHEEEIVKLCRATRDRIQYEADILRAAQERFKAQARLDRVRDPRRRRVWIWTKNLTGSLPAQIGLVLAGAAGVGYFAAPGAGDHVMVRGAVVVGCFGIACRVLVKLKLIRYAESSQQPGKVKLNLRNEEAEKEIVTPDGEGDGHASG